MIKTPIKKATISKKNKKTVKSKGTVLQLEGLRDKKVKNGTSAPLAAKPKRTKALKAKVKPQLSTIEQIKLEKAKELEKLRKLNLAQKKQEKKERDLVKKQKQKKKEGLKAQEKEQRTVNLRQFVSFLKIAFFPIYLTCLLAVAMASLFRSDPENIAAKPIIIGKFVMLAFITIFIIWGALAPINSASIAPGQMVLDYNKKTLQHLEGGIVETLLVKEGQYVSKGQPLLFLRDVATNSQKELLSRQLWTQEAIKMRLRYERDSFSLIQDFATYERVRGLQKIVGPLNVKNAALVEEKGRLDYDDLHINYGFSNKLYEIISNQKALYSVKENSYVSKIGILYKRIGQFQDEIVGIKAQKSATTKQIKVVYQEYKIVKRLVKNNNSPLIRKLEIQKQIAELEGRLGELEAAIAKANQAISETELEIVNFQNETLNQIIAELQETEVKISDISEQLSSARDVLRRTMVTSPISGNVMNLNFHTIGAVIPPGGEILYVVPQDERVIVEAKLSPQDIDLVHAGLEAKIQLSAYKAKKVPKLTGEVVSVSADSILDEQTGSQFFLARVKIPESELDMLTADVRLYPGMPADIFVVTGSRTFFDYLFSPIKDAAYRAFREE